MIAIIVSGLGGLSVGAAIGAALVAGLAQSKGFEQGMSDGQSQGLRGMSDGDRVHVTVDTLPNGAVASGNGVVASLRSEQVRNDA